MGIGVIMFALFLFSALPHVLEGALYQWDRLDKSDASKEQLRAKFVEHPAYRAMYERFPNATEDLSHYGGNDGRMTVGVMNFENNHQLQLELYYNNRDDRVRVDVNCHMQPDYWNSVEGVFAEDFIRNTDCLESTQSSQDDPVETQHHCYPDPHAPSAITCREVTAGA